MNERTVWTEARVARLRKLATMDYSYSEIADSYGAYRHEKRHSGSMRGSGLLFCARVAKIESR